MYVNFEDMYFPDKVPVNGVANDNIYDAELSAMAGFFPEGHAIATMEVDKTDMLAQCYALIKALFATIDELPTDEARYVLNRIRFEINDITKLRGL